MLVTPEHRLSLMLKRQELWEQGKPDLCSLLDKLDSLPYKDILDESDELLHHRFQLIYAWGSAESLRSLFIRAQAAQTLLQLVSEQAEQGRGVIGHGLNAKECGFVVPTDAENKPGAFFGLRLLPGKPLQEVLPILARELAEALVDSPPYEMRWMKENAIKVMKTFLFCTDLKPLRQRWQTFSVLFLNFRTPWLISWLTHILMHWKLLKVIQSLISLRRSAVTCLR